MFLFRLRKLLSCCSKKKINSDNENLNPDSKNTILQATDSNNETKSTQTNECREYIYAAPCVVCMIECRTHAFYKCGHLCVCKQCCAELTNCPICRCVSESMQIYLS